jgi:hypothetical protein
VYKITMNLLLILLILSFKRFKGGTIQTETVSVKLSLHFFLGMIFRCDKHLKQKAFVCHPVFPAESELEVQMELYRDETSLQHIRENFVLKA